MCRVDAERVRVTLSCHPSWPPGGIEVTSPGRRELRAAVIDGRPHEPAAADRVALRQPAAEVILEYG
jgi:hypothetical protein